MEKFKIRISLSSDVNVDLESDNTDIKELVEKVVKFRDKIEVSKIDVNCEEPNFDKTGFKKIVVGLIKKLLNEIKLNEEGLNDVLKQEDSK